jgi:hypothetical protein
MLGLRNAAFLGALSAEEPFSPLDLSPDLWLDAADTSTIISSLGSVSQWNDKSGNAANVSNALSAQQPETGLATINGLNVLSFNGSSDRLRNTVVAAATQPNTLVTVARSTSGVTVTKSLFNATGLPTNAMFYRNSSPRVVSLFAGTVAGVQSVGDQTQPKVLVAAFNGSSSFTRVNGSQSANFNSGSSSKGVGYQIGSNASNSGEFWDGDIAEVLFFDRLLTAGDISLLESYLSAKWGI